MVEGCEDFGFALKTRQPLGVLGEGLWKYLDGDVALQAGITRSVDLTHPAGADGGDDFIRAEPST
ncbi:MAG: hypothetical protein WBD07_17915 [Vicinamibacterales bacterium]